MSDAVKTWTVVVDRETDRIHEAASMCLRPEHIKVVDFRHLMNMQEARQKETQELRDLLSKLERSSEEIEWKLRDELSAANKRAKECCETRDEWKQWSFEKIKMLRELDAANKRIKELEEDYAGLQAIYEEEIGLAKHQRGRKLSLNDERIVQSQRKMLKEMASADLNALKSVLSESIGPSSVEKLLRESRARFKVYVGAKNEKA